MLSDPQLKELLDKALAGNASGEELSSLAEALKQDDSFVLTDQLAARLNSATTTIALPSQERMTMMADAILCADKLPEQETGSKGRVIGWWKWTVAAAVLAAVAITTYFMWPSAKPAADPVATAEPIVAPGIQTGNNKARLILADSSSILLDSIGTGKVSRQGQVEIAKQKDGQLLYSTAGNAATPVTSGELLYNTIAIPRGGQYQLILADGTKVWLNAASSLRFPVAFAAGERRVQLDGEGYFEVAKEANRPFIVQTKTADVQVLGTHFNVFAYADEAWKTTLFEGSVAVKLLSSQAILKPGNQAIVKAGGNDITTVRDANTEEAIAWKEGYFHFNDADVVSIMNQLSRWYDVDIIYNGSVKSSLFTGKGRINRNIKLLGVVNALKEGGIKCKIDQNRLVVYP
ncbi:FecR family protein [Paraflavitalea sp. CAU 1676]|uniref:FecR family protein n=1 Tax=Paraflavitalea sp. CAU 1676 TaxID=3032598 RepID=UPI0023D9AC5A|nr:FecR family protein [Paraflavitalea sp. CAU 1676]MDF2187936.1 FecR domain-containing protein [Paraflavitalea sp. CAU 1676]